MLLSDNRRTAASCFCAVRDKQENKYPENAMGNLLSLQDIECKDAITIHRLQILDVEWFCWGVERIVVSDGIRAVPLYCMDFGVLTELRQIKEDCCNSMALVSHFIDVKVRRTKFTTAMCRGENLQMQRADASSFYELVSFKILWPDDSAIRSDDDLPWPPKFLIGDPKIVNLTSSWLDLGYNCLDKLSYCDSGAKVGATVSIINCNPKIQYYFPIYFPTPLVEVQVFDGVRVVDVQCTTRKWNLYVAALNGSHYKNSIAHMTISLIDCRFMEGASQKRNFDILAITPAFEFCQDAQHTFDTIKDHHDKVGTKTQLNDIPMDILMLMLERGSLHGRDIANFRNCCRDFRYSLTSLDILKMVGTKFIEKNILKNDTDVNTKQYIATALQCKDTSLDSFIMKIQSGRKLECARIPYEVEVGVEHANTWMNSAEEEFTKILWQAVLWERVVHCNNNNFDEEMTKFWINGVNNGTFFKYDPFQAFDDKEVIANWNEMVIEIDKVKPLSFGVIGMIESQVHEILSKHSAIVKDSNRKTLINSTLTGNIKHGIAMTLMMTPGCVKSFRNNYYQNKSTVYYRASHNVNQDDTELTRNYVTHSICTTYSDGIFPVRIDGWASEYPKFDISKNNTLFLHDGHRVLPVIVSFEDCDNIYCQIQDYLRSCSIGPEFGILVDVILKPPSFTSIQRDPWGESEANFGNFVTYFAVVADTLVLREFIDGKHNLFEKRLSYGCNLPIFHLPGVNFCDGRDLPEMFVTGLDSESDFDLDSESEFGSSYQGSEINSIILGDNDFEVYVTEDEEMFEAGDLD